MKFSLWGGEYGTLSVVLDDAVFLAEADVTWIVPTSNGVYPTFRRGTTEDQKKTAISEFIQEETDIKKVDVVHELLKNMFIKAMDESYMMKLRQGIREHDGVTLRDLLRHVFQNYGKMDNHLVDRH